MDPVLQSRLPADFWADGVAPRLPGVRPLAPGSWLLVDDVFAGQMALRDGMIADRRAQVLMLDRAGYGAAQELLHHVLGAVETNPSYQVGPDIIHRPDGIPVTRDPDDPLATAGRLVQEDLCLLQKINGEHVLTGAVLCFPSHWTLAEKFRRPLVAIHRPIAAYDENIARRVQRMFDAIRPGAPLLRFNRAYHQHPDLFAPMLETDTPPPGGPDAPPDIRPYIRVERQVMRRLPKTGAVAFSIHTTVIRRGVA